MAPEVKTNFNNVSLQRAALTSEAIEKAEETDKKQKQKLFHLATVLQELEQDVSGAKEEMQNPRVSSSEPIVVKANDSEGTHGVGALVEMALMLQLLEVIIAKATDSKAALDNTIAQAQVTALKAELTNIANQQKTVLDAQEKQKTIDTWIKVGEILATVLVVAVSLAFGQVEIAALAITMLALTMSGALDKAAGGISSIFQDMGVSKKVADILGKVVVLILIAGLTFVAAPEAAADVAGEAVEDGTEIASTAAEEATEDSFEMGVEEGAESTSESTSTARSAIGRELDKIKQAAKEFQQATFGRLSIRQNLIIMNVLQAAASVNLTDSIVDAIPMSDEKKRDWKIALMVLLLLMNITAGIGGGMAISDAMDAGNVANGSSILGKALTKAASKLASSRSALTRFAQVIQNGLTRTRQIAQSVPRLIKIEEALRRMVALTVAGLQGGEGGWKISEGLAVIQLAIAESVLATDNSIFEQITQGAAGSQKHEGDVLKAHKFNDQTIEKLFAGQEAFADLLTEYSPLRA